MALGCGGTLLSLFSSRTLFVPPVPRLPRWLFSLPTCLVLLLARARSGEDEGRGGAQPLEGLRGRF